MTKRITPRGRKAKRSRAVSSWGVRALTWRTEPQRPRSTARRPGRWRTGRRRRCTDQSRSSPCCTPSLNCNFAWQARTNPCSRSHDRSFSCRRLRPQLWRTDRTRRCKSFPPLCCHRSPHNSSIWARKLKDQKNELFNDNTHSQF